MSRKSFAHHPSIHLLLLSLVWLLASSTSFAQGSAFTYQGRLTDSGNPADGIFDIEFRLFDTQDVGTGAQQGPTVTQSSVQVMNGVFTVQLDFGAVVFSGSPRFLEIRVRPAGSPDPYTTLAPRQAVTPTPYAIRSITADTATNASQLSGISSGGFIQNTSSQQLDTDFNISGDGTAGGTLSAVKVNAATQYNIGSSRVLSAAGTNNLFAGVGAGSNNAVGQSNSFFGANAGLANVAGDANSFFGSSAGLSNTEGINNSFFGAEAGLSNLTGSGNSFFGRSAGLSNTLGGSNAFFGANAGSSNTSGDSNSFFGAFAGSSNITGGGNSFFGFNVGFSNTMGESNAFFGTAAGFRNNTGSRNSFFGNAAGSANQFGNDNSFFGYFAGVANTSGNSNAFFGRNAGFNNTTGSDNSFFGGTAGQSNTTGEGNTFVGRLAGLSNTIENNNTFIGFQANGAAGITNATAIGANAQVTTSNTMVLGTAAVTVRVPGSLIVTGTVSKGGGSFTIDHPLDPANKTLSHSFVESPDMMNIYNGNVTTDRRGEAVVTLPEWFEALNRDFRYQLTVIGQFAQAIVASKIKNNRFRIKTNRPGVEVSWQVTGIRQDAYANRHRIPVEKEKPERERGSYLHPEAFAQPDR